MSIRSVAREASAEMLRLTGVPWLLHRAHRRSSATILLYHDPKPADLDAHLQHLRARHSFVTLDEIVRAVASGDLASLPDHALALTFDDGHRGNYELLAVFRRHGVIPTIYLCSQVVGTRRRFWFQNPGSNPGPYKQVTNRARLAALKQDCGFEQTREYPERQALSDREIDEMAPWVDFQVHTRFHPLLPRCDAEEAWEEIAASKRDLEERLGRECRHFSYPNGDCSDRDAELVQRAGFASARTTELGWVNAACDLWRMPCFGVTDAASPRVFAAQLTGIPSWIRRRTIGHQHWAWEPPAE